MNVVGIAKVPCDNSASARVNLGRRRGVCFFGKTAENIGMSTRINFSKIWFYYYLPLGMASKTVLYHSLLMYSICPTDHACCVVYSLFAPLTNQLSSQRVCLREKLRTRSVQADISMTCHHLTSEASSAHANWV